MKTLLAMAMVGVLALATCRAKAADLPQPVVLKGHKSRVSTVVWADDGKSLATASDVAKIIFEGVRIFEFLTWGANPTVCSCTKCQN